jgi:pSer/pThr/pTyr-binding forkhead associated (FHA) protein
MSKPYTVGRGSAADIQIPKIHDAVGKLHLEIQDAGSGQVTITDLKSTNGTFVRVGKKWEEIKGTRTLPLDAEIMLGDYQTTPRRLLAEALTAPVEGEKLKYRSTKEEDTPPTPPVKKRTGPRRNEFGEIVHE